LSVGRSLDDPESVDELAHTASGHDIGAPDSGQ
jgi:hypothetical protein